MTVTISSSDEEARIRSICLALDMSLTVYVRLPFTVRPIRGIYLDGDDALVLNDPLDKVAAHHATTGRPWQIVAEQRMSQAIQNLWHEHIQRRMSAKVIWKSVICVCIQKTKRIKRKDDKELQTRVEPCVYTTEQKYMYIANALGMGNDFLFHRYRYLCRVSLRLIPKEFCFL